MSKPNIFTYEDLKALLRKTVSEKRYMHSLGVARTTAEVLRHFDCTDYEPTWHDFDAPRFCGIVHDIAREMGDGELLAFCRNRGIILSREDIEAPVLAHGTVSAEIAMDLVGSYPTSWYKALCVHTTGNAGMDDLALALFVADYIEPTRSFMTDARRSFYLSSKDLSQCAYRVLCDMIEHWRQTGFHQASSGSLGMKASLEKKGSTYE